MPFTLAHPTIIIPLRGFLPLSALVVGSMSPDFEYLLRLAAISKFSHTLPGIFYFCVPVSLFVLWLFHSVVKQPIIILLPDFVRRRVESDTTKFTFLPLSRLFLIILALILGAFSHIFWDSFTHESGWIVSKISLLQTSVFNFAGTEVKLFKLLQHSSSVIGLLLMAGCFWRWLDNKPVDEAKFERGLPVNIRRQITIALILINGIIGLSYGFWSASGSGGLRYLAVFAVQTAIGAMVAFALCLLLFSLIYKVRNHI